MNEKIIFLDIDGVLNSECFYIKRYRNMKDLEMINISKLNEDNLIVKRLLSNIDLHSLNLIKQVIDKTNSKIVIISGCKSLNCFEKFCGYLINLGLPIIGRTYDNNSDRGTGIKKYLYLNKINSFIVIDDEIYLDYDEEILSHLIKTNYKDGFLDEHINKSINLLNNRKIRKL